MTRSRDASAPYAIAAQHIFMGRLRILGEQFRLTRPGGQEIENERNPDAGPANARLPAADGGIDADAIEKVGHGKILYHHYRLL